MATTTAKCGMTGSTSEGTEISNWTVNLNQEAPEVTSMSSSGMKEYIACLSDADGTFESFIPCGAVGTRTGATFVNDKGTITMDLFIESVNTVVDVNDAVKFTYTFKSTGAVT